MGYVVGPPGPETFIAPPGGVFVLPNGVTFQNVATLRDALGRYPQLRVTPALHYAPRTWADLHLDQLNYGLLGAFASFVAVIVVALAT